MMETNPGLPVRSRIVGRARDVRRIHEYFDAEPGRGLHVVGEAGVGKTTLLDAVAEAVRESGTRVLRADGVRFEADVAYAGLHQILSPVLDRAGELPPEYRLAVDVALGRGSGPAPDRLMVVNAVLALLRPPPHEPPLLLIVDDLHWLDQASATVLGFVARRLSGTRMGFLAASRSGPAGPSGDHGLAELDLKPLDDDSAQLLLAARYPDLAPRARARMVAEARGNPLALLELPGRLTGAQQAGHEELPAVLSLGKRTRGLYVARVAALPVACRRLLLLAALEDTGDLGVLRAAAIAAGPGVGANGANGVNPVNGDTDAGPCSEPDASASAHVDLADLADLADLSGLADLAAAERDRLVRIDAGHRRLVFTHPLIRSTVVDGSTLAERRAAHLALAASAVNRPEVRARHLAEAVIEPDEEVAALLHEAAHAVLRRGDTVGAVAGLVRAADLSPEPADRGRRLAEAAYLGAEAVGDLAKASDLLRRAHGQADDPAVDLGTGGTLYAAAAAVYVLVNSDTDLDTVYRLLAGALEAVGPDYDAEDPALIDALHTLQLVCWWSGRADRWAPYLETVAALTPAPPPVLALAARAFPDPARGGHCALPYLDEVRGVLRATPDPATLVRGATATLYLDRVGEIRDRLWDVVRAGREGRGPARRYLGALTHLAMEDFLTGEWDQVQQSVDEGLELCAAGYPFFAWYFHFNQVLLHGARGESAAGNALAEQMTRWATRRGVGAAAAFARQARTLVCLGSGDFEAAYRHATALTPAGTLAPYRSHALWGVYDLVEAAVRTGRSAEAAAHVKVLRELRIGELSDRYAMLVAGAEGLASRDDRAVEHFERALAVPGADRWVFDAARIRLALGERLRRTAAKSEAREPLAAALDSFVRLGATPWADRARTELRASGQATKAADGEYLLTPQELEIARLAATGLTNRQIGERLFLSHRTVGAHLYRVYPKLGITTRAALRDALTASVESDEAA